MSREHTLGPLRRNPESARIGLTEVRGPYYSSYGPAYLDDLLTVFAPFVDWVKLPGPAVLPARRRIGAQLPGRDPQTRGQGKRRRRRRVGTDART